MLATLRLNCQAAAAIQQQPSDLRCFQEFGCEPSITGCFERPESRQPGKAKERNKKVPEHDHDQRKTFIEKLIQLEIHVDSSLLPPSNLSRSSAQLVPSGSRPSLAPSLRAWPQVSRFRKDWRVLAMLAVACFESSGSLLARASPPVFPVRSRHLGAVFRSPMMTAACGLCGVSVPDLLLRRLVGFSSGPFGPQLLRCYRFAPVPAISTLRTRYLIRVPRFQRRLVASRLRWMNSTGSISATPSCSCTWSRWSGRSQWL